MFPIRDSQPSYSTPVVTRLLIAMNVVVFLFQLTLDPVTSNDFTYAYGFVPSHFSVMNIFTSMFMHGGWMHLISNMLFLWVFGDNVEDVLGHGKFLLLYLASGVAAALAQGAMDWGSRLPMVGASGAIAGVMGAYMLKFPHSNILVGGWFIIIYTFEVPAWLMLLYWFGLQFLNGVGSIAQSQLSRGGTAFFAHIGGFIAGMLMVKLLKPRERFRNRPDLVW
jgi:membrane associated rhomboid family serine protease